MPANKRTERTSVIGHNEVFFIFLFKKFFLVFKRFEHCWFTLDFSKNNEDIFKFLAYHGLIKNDFYKCFYKNVFIWPFFLWPFRPWNIELLKRKKNMKTDLLLSSAESLYLICNGQCGTLIFSFFYIFYKFSNLCNLINFHF